MLRLSLICAAMAFAGGVAWRANAADAPVPMALASLQPGQWQLRSLGSASQSKTLCLGDPRVLLQLRHGSTPCNRFVITDEAEQTVVHYSCNGSGNGRTSVRVETPRVIQIESQGVFGRAPFDLAFEGRRIGNCPASGAAVQK